jgi:hypothetical protein
MKLRGKREWRARSFLGLALLPFFFAAWVWDSQAQDPPPTLRPSDLEAVFLFHFTQFVEWPSDAFATTNSPFVIGILGEHPVVSALRDVLKNEVVKGREFVLRVYQHPDEVRQCHLLFLGKGEEASVPRVLSRLRGQPVLLVSELDGFAQRGGMIEFVTERNKIRLRINVEKTRAANLSVSSKLLRVAEVIPKP